MRIAQLAPLIESVPPLGYGGTELVVSLLTEELVRRGHDVTLFAAGDSETEARLVSVASNSLRNSGEPRHRWDAYAIRSLLRLNELAEQFDIIHNHMGYQALPFLHALRRPIVTTNHNIISDYFRDIYFAYATLPNIAISESYRRLNYPTDLNYVATIYNGIDVEKYRQTTKEQRRYLLFMGRICHDKGICNAIDLASRLKLPLKIAGKIDETDRQYFLTQVQPRLADASIEFVGEVTEEQKVLLYRSAIATLHLINFDEPFGLVMAESLASGTPVIGFRRGSVEEIILDGQTGILGDNIDDLAQRFAELQNISVAACEQRARQLFSKERMTDQYEEVYKALIARFQQQDAMQLVASR